MASIQVAGEALIDLVNSSAHPGGSPMNVAVGLGRLGHEVSLQTGIGDDAYGRLITDHVAESNVVLADGSITSQPTGTAQVQLDSTGAASYEFALNTDMTAVRPTQAEILHTGSIAAFTEPGATVIGNVFASATGEQLKSFDPNLRPALADSRRKVLTRVEKFFALSHVVKLSDEDALWLYPGWDTARILDHILSFGAQLAVMTFGAQGAEARTEHHEITVASHAVTVADTVGAGDSFMSGLLHAIATCSLRTQLTVGVELDKEQLQYALDVARSCAALTVQQVGANPPRLETLEEFMVRNLH